MEEKTIMNEVKQKYGDIALNIKNGANCCGNLDTGSKDNVACCGNSDALSSNKEGIPSLGSDKNLIKYANPKLGEHVVDLGSGPGKDAVSISTLVGEEGHVTGIDFTEEMVGYAYGQVKEKGINNVSFKIGNIINLPIEDNSTDLVISNCVFNLVPNKSKAFKEAYRILKPGGRITISDFTVIGDLTDEEKNNTNNYCGCLAGEAKERYIRLMEDAGFTKIETIPEYSFKQYLGNRYVEYESIVFIGFKPNL